MMPNQRNQKFRPKGQYIILVEKNEDRSIDVYSTDSIFWRDFYKGG